MSTLALAIELAAKTYGDTLGKDSVPAIFHPLRVMMAEYEVAPRRVREHPPAPPERDDDAGRAGFEPARLRASPLSTRLSYQPRHLLSSGPGWRSIRRTAVAGHWSGHRRRGRRRPRVRSKLLRPVKGETGCRGRTCTDDL